MKLTHLKLLGQSTALLNGSQKKVCPTPRLLRCTEQNPELSESASGQYLHGTAEAGTGGGYVGCTIQPDTVAR
jgi:hypothetical protein